MPKILRNLFVLGIIAVCGMTLAPSAVAAANLSFNNELMNADLNQVPLKNVLKQLRVKKGIWWEADPTLLDSKVTVSFNGLSLEKGMERILRNFSCSFVFNADGTLAGLIVVQQGSGSSSRVRSDSDTGPAPNAKTVSAPGRSSSGSDARASIPNGNQNPMQRSSTSAPQGPNNPAMANNQGDQPLAPPGNEADIPKEVRDSFKVKKNQTPPGGNVKPTPEMMKKFKVIKGLPSPEI